MAMDKLNFDLRRFREDHLHLTQKELAELLGLRQDSVSRMEQNPEQMTITTLVKLAQLSGQSLDEVVNYRPVQPRGLEVRRTWAAVKYSSANIQQLLQEYCKPDGLLVPGHRDMVEGLMHLVDILTRKPVLAVAGSFCSGKSTFINSLLGQQLLPASARSNISRPLRVRHIEDRPEGFKSTVYLIRNSAEMAAVESAGDGWLLAEGGTELLPSAGDNPDVGAILVYADSYILRNCDIVRLPSPNFDGPADPASIDVLPDILVYLTGGDKNFSTSYASYFRLLLERMRMLEQPDRPEFGCLSNLFIVCSKAHLLGTEERAQDAARRTGAQLYNTLPPSFWEEREQTTGVFCTEDFFLSRCFIYAVYDDPKWRAQLEAALRITLERMPDAMRRDISQSLRDYRDAVCQELASCAEQPPPEPPEEPWASMRDPERREAVIQQQYWIIDRIDQCKRRSVEQFQSYCRLYLDDNHLKSELEYIGKSNVQQLITRLQTDMERTLKEILNKECRIFPKALEEYLSLFNSPDAKATFAKALARSSHADTLSQWIANPDGSPMTAGCNQLSNRTSSYYVYRKSSLFDLDELFDVSMPTSAGLLGATIAAISYFAGSTALAAVSPAAAVIAAVGMTTSSKKAVNSIQTTFFNNIIPTYEESIRRFWNDISTTFQRAAQVMQKTWEEALQSTDRTPEAALSPEQSAKEARELKGFLESLPL